MPKPVAALLTDVIITVPGTNIVDMAVKRVRIVKDLTSGNISTVFESNDQMGIVFGPIVIVDPARRGAVTAAGEL